MEQVLEVSILTDIGGMALDGMPHTLYLVDKTAAERLSKLFKRVMRRERRYRF